MFSRRLRIAFALGSVFALLAAIVGVNARLSWRPVSIDFPAGTGQSEPQHLPLMWRDNELWLLSNPSGTPGVGAKAVRIWKPARNWNRTPFLLVNASGASNSLATVCSSQNLFAFVGDGDANIQLWRNTSSLRTFKERGHRNSRNTMNPGQPSLLSLSPDGTRLAANSELFGYGDYEENQRGFCNFGLVVFDTASGRQLARQSAVEGGFTDVVWSPDSREVAGIGADGWVFVLDGAMGKLRLKFRAHNLFGAQIAWSPDGKTLVTASNPRVEFSPTGFSYAFRKEGGEISSHSAGTTTIGEGKSKIVISSNAQGEMMWNRRTERLLKRFDARTGQLIGSALPLETGAVDLAFSPDGTQLALGQHNFALVLNAQTLQAERRLNIPTPRYAALLTPEPVCVAWSKDGTTLATSTSRGLLLWRMR